MNKCFSLFFKISLKLQKKCKDNQEYGIRGKGAMRSNGERFLRHWISISIHNTSRREAQPMHPDTWSVIPSFLHCRRNADHSTTAGAEQSWSVLGHHTMPSQLLSTPNTDKPRHSVISTNQPWGITSLRKSST